MNRLPIRLRLTLPFALAMAGVLAALGVFVYVRVGNALLSSTDQALQAQAAEATARSGEHRLLDPDATRSAPAELLDARGNVVRSSPPGLRSFLDRRELERVLRGRNVRRSGALPRLKEDWRLLAVPVHRGSSRALILTRSLEPREETLGRLVRELLIAAPLGLLLAGAAGYGLAAAALRPVEAMRRRAAAISASTPGRRLPVPGSGDEISRLAATLNDMLERLEAAFAHERRFVDDASHELRTPLALLRTELELALRRPRSHAELESALASASEEAERLARLADDLLLLARSDQSASAAAECPVEVGSLLREVAGRFAARAGEAGRTIDVAGGANVEVRADRPRLERAVENLVENALTHGDGAVTLSAERRDGTVELHVIDQGDGFPPDFLGRAFERFSRADDARGRGGAGLGLSIVAAIAEAAGGRAAARNTADGADAWIAIPAA
jgi:two-component system OmpR family sensor kinase